MTEKVYALYAKQVDEGCDYTIGCAQTLIVLGPVPESELDDRIREVVEDHEFGSDHCKLEEFALVEIIRDLEVHLFTPEDHEDPEKEQRCAQYEQLKREFGDD